MMEANLDKTMEAKMNNAADVPQMIYGVSFYVNPRKKVRTFWFLDKQNALRFMESVKNYPKMLDYSMFEIVVDDVEEYDGVVEEGQILLAKVD